MSDLPPSVTRYEDSHPGLSLQEQMIVQLAKGISVNQVVTTHSGEEITLDIFPGVMPASTPDSESSKALFEAIEKNVERGKKVLEVGPGSGILSIIMSKKGADVTAIDYNRDAVDCTQVNAKANNVRLNSHHGDLFTIITNKYNQIVNPQTGIVTLQPVTEHVEKFNIIVANLPFRNANLYKKSDEPMDYSNGVDLALKDPDWKLHERFLKEAKEHLEPGGRIILSFANLLSFQGGFFINNEGSSEVLDPREDFTRFINMIKSYGYNVEHNLPDNIAQNEVTWACFELTLD